MKLTSVEAVVRGLHDATTYFLIVGGLAVVAHGYGRLTQDIDLVIRLDGENVRKAFGATSPRSIASPVSPRSRPGSRYGSSDWQR